MRAVVVWAALTLAAFTMSGPAEAQSQCRLYLAEQYDWAGNRGFYLDFEGDTLAALPLILGVADGSNWRFPRYTAGFAFDTDYQIRAVITPETAQVFLDGEKVVESAGGWAPADGSLTACDRPAWASGPGDWLADVHSVQVALARGGEEVERRTFDFSASTGRPVPLQLFEPYQPSSCALAALPGDTVTVDVSLRFLSATPDPWEPFIDSFEQSVHADWPDKVGSAAELVADIAAEDAVLDTMPPSDDFDEYGGYLLAGWQEIPTGFFRALQRDGYWWLITPLGNPCFYLGVSTFPAQAWDMTPITGRESLYESLPAQGEPHASAWGRDVWGIGEAVDYFCFHSWNLHRKYGEDWWASAEERGIRRLQHWGFSGGSKWGAPQSVVSTPVLWWDGVPNLVDHPDVFDPTVRGTFRQVLEAQIAPLRDDPRILGWSVGSERKALIFGEEVLSILLMPSTTPGKRALLDYAVGQIYGGSVTDLAAAWGLSVTTRNQLYASSPVPPATDVELMRRYYADRFYEFCYTTVKDIDPNHLYLGCYLCPVCDEAEVNWRIIARHCDVVSYDFYRSEYEDERLLRLEAEAGKPVFCGEFSFPAWYDGWRGFGRYWSVYARDDAAAGEMYSRFVEGAARDPYCVGLAWFQYHDQPLTGRGSGSGPDLVYGEHYAFGLVTVTDRPKWEQVTRMREANLQAPEWRMAAPKGPFHDVPPTHWAAGEIGACAAAGIVGGYDDGTYRPDEVVTRDQMAVYIARALAGSDELVPTGPATPAFDDVGTNHWAYKYVEYVRANNVAEGYDEVTYGPNMPTDRAQMAVFIARAIVTPTGDAGLATYMPPATATFSDVPVTGYGSGGTDPHWAYTYIEYIAEDSVAVSQGYDDGTYRPETPCTRDQMAVYVTKAFGLPM
jgi:hypothetical protein